MTFEAVGSRPADVESSMLIIKRRADESIVIEPSGDADTSISVAELFASGAIEIRLLDVGPRRVTIAIDAPKELKIWRDGRPDRICADNDEEDAA